MGDMTTEQENLIKVLPRILKLVQEDEFFAEGLANELESFLDGLAEQDAFGTERQCDPRGDFRVREWSLFDEVQEEK